MKNDITGEDSSGRARQMFEIDRGWGEARLGGEAHCLAKQVIREVV